MFSKDTFLKLLCFYLKKKKRLCFHFSKSTFPNHNYCLDYTALVKIIVVPSYFCPTVCVVWGERTRFAHEREVIG